MAIAHILGTTVGNGSTAVSTAVSFSITGASAGHFFICSFSTNSGTTTNTNTDSCTLNLGPTMNGLSNQETWIYSKFLTSADITRGTIRFTMSISGRLSGVGSVFSGVDTTTPVETVGTPVVVTSAASSGTNPTLSSVSANGVLWTTYALRVAAVTNQTPGLPTGYSASALSADAYTTSPNYSTRAAYKATTTVGSYGGDTSTYTGSAADSINNAVILKQLVSNSAPTIAPNTADASTFSTTTPTLAFTGSDADSDDLQYEVEIDSVNTFNSTSTTATPALVNTWKITDAAASPGTTTLTGVTSGNMIVVDTSTTLVTSGIITGVTDSASNSYTKRYDAGTSGAGSTEWYAFNVTGGNLTLNVAFTATSTDMSAVIREFSGIDTASPADGTAHTASASSNAPASGNMTTTNANDLIIGHVVDIGGTGQTYTLGTGYSNIDSVKAVNSANTAVEYKTVTSAGTQAAAMTLGTSGQWVAAVSAYKAGTALVPLLDKFSATDAGFLDVPNNADTQPFTAGNQVSYTVQSALAAGTYYWRARVIDPSGTNTYSSWSTTRSFTISTGPTTISITKALTYRVKAVPTAPTKTLKYTTKTTPSAATKSLKYTTKKSLAITKGLIYEVKKSLSITKSLKYTTKTTPSALTKSLRYATKAPTAITKSLKYTVARPASALTKQLKYTVKRPASAITKTLKYTVKTIGAGFGIGLNLTAYWKLNEIAGTTAADSAGNNTGTWQGTVTSQWGTGKINGGGVFNGSDYIAIGDNAALSFNTGNFTLSAWVKTSATSRQTIVHKYLYTGTSIESGYYIDMLTGGTVRTVYETTNANLRNTDSSITINDGNWHLVTVVRPSTTGDILLYIDGVLDSSATHSFNAGTPGNIDNTVPFAIGQSINTSIGVNNWTGAIDEVGTWNRALTNTEISRLYNSGTGLSYPFDGLRKVLTYAVKTIPTATTKSLRYAINKPSAITKSLKYTVLKTPSAITKSLRYATAKPIVITKSLKYTVRKATSITKGLIYDIKRPVAITKSLKYTTKTAVSITKQLKYVAGSNSSLMTKSLKYTVTASHAALTKTLKYAVKTTPASLINAITNGDFETGTGTTNANFSVNGWQVGTVGSASVISVDTTTSNTGSQSIKLAVDATNANNGLRASTANQITAVRNTVYRLVIWTKSDTAGQLQIQLRDGTVSGVTGNYLQPDGVTWNTTASYFNVNTSTTWAAMVIMFTSSSTGNFYISDFKRSGNVSQANRTFWIDTVSINQLPLLQLSMRYAIDIPAAITKSLVYDVKIPRQLTKALKYTVKTSHAAITKPLKYAVINAAAISFSYNLKYTVRSPRQVTKSLKYTVKLPHAITKSLTYNIAGAAIIINRSLKYTVKRPIVVTKSLRYTVKTGAHSMTKAMTYRVRTTATMSKVLSYRIATTHLISLALRYNVRSSSAITKALTYRAFTPAVPHAISRSLEYDVYVAPQFHDPLLLSQRPEPLYLVDSRYVIPMTNGDSTIRLGEAANSGALQLDVKSNSIMLE